MARILILAEPSELFEFVGHALAKEGHQVRLAYDLRQLVSRIRTVLPNLVVVDAASLPETFDSSVLMSHRHSHPFRVLILQATSNAESRGPTLKGNAYLQRPFDPSSLIAHVEILLAKESVDHPAGEKNLRDKLILGDLVIDPNSFQVTRSGKLISLTIYEFRLLYYLASNPNTVYRRGHLLNVVLAKPRTPARRLDAFVRHLRNKLEEDPHKPRLICSVYRQGYRFQAPADEALDENAADGSLAQAV